MTSHYGSYEDRNYGKWAIWSWSTDSKGRVKKVQEYVNLTTGEVLPAEELRIPHIDSRSRQPLREKVIKSLRPEVREFAVFLLAFRNKRRGLSPSVPVLCRWYADLTGKQVPHVRRYVIRLTQVGILAGENILGVIWQRTGGKSRDHLGEDTSALVTYVTRYLMGKAKNGSVLTMSSVDKPPSWSGQAGPTGNLLPFDSYAAVMRRITGRAPLLKPHEYALAMGRSISLSTGVAADEEHLCFRSLWRLRQWYQGRFYGPLLVGNCV